LTIKQDRDLLVAKYDICLWVVGSPFKFLLNLQVTGADVQAWAGSGFEPSRPVFVGRRVGSRHEEDVHHPLPNSLGIWVLR